MAPSNRSTTSERRYWLFKTEPGCYSIDDLAREKNQTTFWDGVRNYQARNMLRDDVRVGDRVLVYYSSVDPMCIAGTARVVRGGYSDHTAFEPGQQHYDPKSDPDKPAWYMVDVRLVQKFAKPVTRDALKECADLAGMAVLQRGSRLSIQPVTADEWRTVHRLAGVKDPA